MPARKRTTTTKRAARKRPTSLLKSAEAPLDGCAALLKRAADRLNTASAYAGDGAHNSAWMRFIDGRELVVQALVQMDRIWREFGR